MIDDLILSKKDVNDFYVPWIHAMRSAQNAPAIDGDDGNSAGDEREAAALVRSMLPTGPNIDIQIMDISKTQTRPNIIVTYTPPGVDPGKEGILFAGVHMDCVPVGSDEHLLTYQYDGEKGIGRGVVDNGSNVLACIKILNYVVNHSELFNRPLVFSFNADEEDSGTSFGFDGLVEEGLIDPKNFAAAIFADTGWGAWSTKGVATWELGVTVDKPGHSGDSASAGSIALDIYGQLIMELADEYPDVGPYRVASVIQANTFILKDQAGKVIKNSGDRTKTIPYICIGGDIRTNPPYSLDDIISSLHDVVTDFEQDIRTNPQYAGYGDTIHIDFEVDLIDDGYLMDPGFEDSARSIIEAGFEAAGIEGQEPLHYTGGGLPGLRGFAEQHKLLTVATGAYGRKQIADEEPHTAHESIYIDDVCRSPAYLLGVAMKMDEELTARGD